MRENESVLLDCFVCRASGRGKLCLEYLAYGTCSEWAARLLCRMF